MTNNDDPPRVTHIDAVLQTLRRKPVAMDNWTSASDNARAFINEWAAMNVKDKMAIFIHVTEEANPDKAIWW